MLLISILENLLKLQHKPLINSVMHLVKYLEVILVVPLESAKEGFSGLGDAILQTGNDL
jgi:hypothetical protein